METPYCYEFSPNGDHLFIGTSSGRVYRVSGLRQAYTVEELEALEVVQIYSGGVFITDLSIDPDNDNRLLASKGSYTGTNHVVYTENALSATSNDDFTEIWNIDGDLVNMPVYSVTFDRENNNILAGTEYGVFVTSDFGETQWQECIQVICSELRYMI